MNASKTPRRLAVSFSGGETSAYMTHLCLTEWRDRYDEIAVTFANTGQEREETLRFIRACDDLLGFGTVWVEAVVHHGERRANTHRVVTYETASRNGEPFEESIRKYGIPNQTAPNCTRDLKLCPMRSYLRSIGWDAGSYDTAVGIRGDEVDRISPSKDKERLVYPFIEWRNVTKPEVNAWWRDQPFRLELRGYQGNCKWCWKKSMRKLLTLREEDASIFDFPARMEAENGRAGPEFKKPNGSSAPDRTFFRQRTSTRDLLETPLPAGFRPASDDSVNYNVQLDLGLGCDESCEVFGSDDEAALRCILERGEDEP